MLVGSSVTIRAQLAISNSAPVPQDVTKELVDTLVFNCILQLFLLRYQPQLPAIEATTAAGSAGPSLRPALPSPAGPPSSPGTPPPPPGPGFHQPSAGRFPLRWGEEKDFRPGTEAPAAGQPGMPLTGPGAAGSRDPGATGLRGGVCVCVFV